MTIPRRQYSRAEQWADRLLHHVGLVSAVVAVVVLLALTHRYQDGLALFAVALYGVGLITMLVASTLANHDLSADSAAIRGRERFDHAAIFAMIAGTYTPLTLIVLPGSWGWALLLLVWGLALIGGGLKLAGRLGYRSTIAFYLGLGWSILPAIGPLVTAMAPLPLALLITGGIVYSLGVVAFTASRLPFHTVIWHTMVLVAAGCHYAAILTSVALPRAA
jgi:hemolysin III